MARRRVAAAAVKYGKVRAVRRFAEAKREALDPYARAPSVDGGYDPCDWPERLDEIRALVRQVDSSELTAVLDVLSREWPFFQGAVVAWVDLIDTLVQNTERRYAPKGRGPLKKEEVKSVLVYLIRSERFDLPQVPNYIEPVVIDVFADITVDAIVQLLNTFSDESWVEAVAERPRAEPLRVALLLVKRVLVNYVVAPIARIGVAVYWLWRRPFRLTPAVRSAVDALEETAPLTTRGGTLNHVANVARTLAHNHRSVVAGVKIAGIVVDAVEGLPSMTGPQKKECAKRLFYAVLDDLGFDRSSMIVRVKLDIGLDLAIDAIVQLFNKRHIFPDDGRPPVVRGPDLTQSAARPRVRPLAARAPAPPA